MLSGRPREDHCGLRDAPVPGESDRAAHRPPPKMLSGRRTTVRTRASGGHDTLRQPRGDSRWLHAAHHVAPLTGIPDHSLVRVRCACRTARKPVAVTLKYVFARPPRTADVDAAERHLSPAALLDGFRNRHAVGIVAELQQREQHQQFEASEELAARHMYDNIE